MANFSSELRMVNTSFHYFKSRAFTLIEIMVALSVLTIIGLLSAQMISATSKGSQASGRVVDEAAQSRLVLDRIGYDLSFMPHRRDIDYVFGNTKEGDVMRFLSQVSSVRGDRGLSLIAYQMRPDVNGRLALYRGSHGYEWDESGFLGITQEGSPMSLKKLPKEMDVAEEDYDLLSESVFKIAFAFQYKSDGKLYAKPPTLGGSEEVVNLKELAAIIVGVALIDTQSRELLTKDNLSDLSSRFSEIPDGTSPLMLWHKQLNENFSQISQGLPKKAVQSVQIFQRFYSME